MPTLTPASPDTLTLTPVTGGGVGYAGFYPSATTYPSSTLYPGIASTSSAILSFGIPSTGTATGTANTSNSFFGIPGIDILENGDFEIGTQQWTAQTSTISRDTTHVYHGNYALKCVCPGIIPSEGFELATTTPPTVTTNLVPIPTGAGFTANLVFYAYGDGVGSMRGLFDFYDSNLNFIFSAGDVVTPPAAWTRYVVTRASVTNSNVAWANIRFLTPVGAPTTLTFWIDYVAFAIQTPKLTLTPA